ncbi:hypothetical protein DJ68_01310, partial [Halorubrum sp. C3]
LEEVTSSLQELEFLNGPEWGQKHYVAFNKGRKRRISIWTQRTQFHVELYDVDTTSLNATEIADALKIDVESVAVKEDMRGNGRSGVKITCEPAQEIDFDALESQAREILGETTE